MSLCFVQATPEEATTEINNADAKVAQETNIETPKVQETDDTSPAEEQAPSKAAESVPQSEKVENKVNNCLVNLLSFFR